jgi:antitoxin (DNA-binding transcriptional repressor) of toxin-antitoxin stability system
VQVKMLDAKSQLSRLAKAALAGEEVMIASHGNPQVKWVPCAASRHPGEALVTPLRTVFSTKQTV